MIDFPNSPTTGDTFTSAGVMWTWDGIKWTASGLAALYLPLAGGTLSGPLLLAADPTTFLGAVTKEYADGLPFLPLTGGQLSNALWITMPNATFTINKALGTQYNRISAMMSATRRWDMDLGDNSGETGSNAGSNFALRSYADGGANIGVPLSINRATGLVTIPNLSSPGIIIPSGDNKIINGDMRINQRASGAQTAFGYFVDRWEGLGSQSAKFSFGQLTVTGFPFSWAIQAGGNATYTVLATDYFCFSQPIEADMISDLMWGTSAAQPATLSFWANSFVAAGGTFSGCLTNYVQGTGANRSFPFSFSLPLANTWYKIIINIPGDTAGTWNLRGNGLGAQLNFDLGCGANFRSSTPGAWQAGNFIGVTGSTNVVGAIAAQQLILTGVKFEAGSIATPFAFQTLAKRLSDCQRYYEKSYEPSVVPGTVTPIGQRVLNVGGWSLSSAPTGQIQVQYAVQKRQGANVTVYSPATLNASSKVRDQQNSADLNATVNYSGSNSFAIQATTGGTSSFINLAAHWTADAEF